MNRADKKRIMNEVVEAQVCLSKLAWFIHNNECGYALLKGQAELASTFCKRAVACITDIKNKGDADEIQPYYKKSCAGEFVADYMERRYLKNNGLEEDESGV